MKKWVIVALCLCFFVAVGSAEEKQKSSAPEDIWKELKVKVGALIKLSALFEDPHGQSDYNNYFKVDHIFINIKGSFAKDFKFFIQPHYSQKLPGGGTVNGANMFVDYVRFPVKIRFGKFMYPGSLGAFTPASKMDFATRPKMSAETALPQCRDIGLMLFGDAFKTKIGERDFNIKLFGSITNGKDRTENEALMYVARTEVSLKGLFQFGACYLKNHQPDEWIPTYGGVNDLRYGSVDLTVFYESFRFGGEFIHGLIDDAGDRFYFEGYYLKGFARFWEHGEAGVRYELWDRNRDEHYRTEVITVGVTFMFNPKNPHAAKVQLNWFKVREGDPGLVDSNNFEILLQLSF